MSTTDEMMDLGLAWMTGGIDGVGATGSDYRSKIASLDEKIRGTDDSIFQWQLGKYSPHGLLALGDTDNDIVTAEQAFYRSWQAFTADWGKAHDRLLSGIDKLRDPLGGDEEIPAAAGMEIDHQIAIERAQYDKFKADFEKVVSDHEKAVAHGDLALKDVKKAIPWGKIALGAGALIGIFFLLKWLGKRAERKALEAEIIAAGGLPDGAMPSLDGSRPPPAWRRAYDKARTTLITPVNPATGVPSKPPPMPPMYVPPTARMTQAFPGGPFTLMSGMPPPKRFLGAPTSMEAPPTVRDTAPPPTAPFSAPPTMVTG